MVIKTYIDQEKLKKLIERKLSYYHIHAITGYPISVIQRIKKGKKVDWFVSRENLRVEARKKFKGKLICSHCGLQPVADGNRFLCYHCFRNADNGSVI